MAAKELFIERSLQVWQMLLDRWSDFREQSPYFQAKVALVTGWVVVTLLTVVLVPPSPATFVVEQRMISFGLAEKTAVMIFNRAGGDIPDGVVQVRGTMTDFDGKKTQGIWTTKGIPILQGVKTTLATESFFDPKGFNPAYQLQIDHIVITAGNDVVWSGPPMGPSVKL